MFSFTETPPEATAMVESVDPTHPFVSTYSMLSARRMFHEVLTSISSAPAGGENESSSYSTNYSAYSNYNLEEAAEKTINSTAVCVLRNIADRMRSESNVRECIQAYKAVRKDFLCTSLLSLGVEKQSTSYIRHLLSSDLKPRIDCCENACDASRFILFPSEKDLCAKIFEGEDERAMCYSGTIEDTLVQLIGYANSLISAPRFSVLLFKHFDLYRALGDLLWSTSGVLTKHCQDSIDELAKKIRRILSDFEMSVIHELSTSTVPKAGGEIVSLTKYVTHYLTRITEYDSRFTNEIVSEPHSTSIVGPEKIPDVEYAQIAGRTPLELHVVYIVVLLRFKLEKKSKYYYKSDSAKSYLFLANNLAHIVRCIAESPELENMIGNPYVSKLRDEYLTQAMRNYQRKTCDNMLQCLRMDSAGRCFPGIPSSTMTVFKRKIKSFNTMFEESRLNQARLMALVEELRLWQDFSVPIEEELVGAYTNFLKRLKYRVGALIKM